MRSVVLIALLAALAVPVGAAAQGTPSPAAVAACNAELAALGREAFVAKYGPEEVFGHCYAAHASDVAPVDDSLEAKCKRLLAEVGADAFRAKFGSLEIGACVRAATTPPPPAKPVEPRVAACQAEAEKLGKEAFVAKYGPDEAWGHCYAARGKAAATKACVAEAKKLGKERFDRKYGKTEPVGSCVKQRR